MMRDGSRAGRDRGVGRRRVLYAVAAMALGVLIAETACRLLTALFLPSVSGPQIRRSMQAVMERPREGEQPVSRESIHPYFGYVSPPGVGMEEKSYPVTPGRLAVQVGPAAEPWWLELETNNWGFWSPHPMPYIRGDDDFVVVVLGGSVAQWLALQGRDAFEEELALRSPDLGGRRVVVLNCALGGYKQPQQVAVLAYLLSRGVRPDAVINLDGFNEAAIAHHNAVSGVSPEYPRADLWPFLVSGLGYSDRALGRLAGQFREKQRAVEAARRAMRWSRFSNVLGILFAHRARAAQAREQVLHAEFQRAVEEDLPAFRRFAARGPTTRMHEDRVMEEIVRIWFESSVTLASICRGRDIAYVHVLQPTLHDPSAGFAKPRTVEEQAIARTRAGTWGAWAEGVRRIYPRFRERAGDLRGASVAFRDLSGLFATTEETVYYDICHYNQQGNEMLARAIARFLADRLGRDS